VPHRWQKRGRLWEDGRGPAWAKSHAALPVVDRRAAGGHRVYFSCRDDLGRSRVGWADGTIADPGSWTFGDRPAVDLGALGSFDDSGVTSSCIVNCDGRKYQYYTGWSLGVTVPFYLSVGLAISEDDGETYRRVSQAPVFERSDVDPFLTASPWVLVENGVWRAWYVSGARWVLRDARPQHQYHIRYAESRDGLQWDRRGIVCIDFKSEDEYAISRPCVIRDPDRYRMWYAYRGASYRIGYAESTDGVVWTRKDDEVGIGVSSAGWDSEMVEYPCVVDAGPDRVMLYNGNAFGKTGIGVASCARHEAAADR
jgi:hypothetical protein